MTTKADILADPKHVAELDFVIDKFNMLPLARKLELAGALQGDDPEKYATAGRVVMDLLMKSSGTTELLDYVTKKLNLAVQLSFYHIIPEAKQLNARANFLAGYFREHLHQENGIVTIDSLPIPDAQTLPYSRKRP